MRSYKALYVKELKTIFIPSLLLALSYGLIILYFQRLDISSIEETFKFASNVRSQMLEFSNLMMNSILIVTPIMLAYSLYVEWIQKTSQQLLALPVSRYTVLLCKYLAVMNAGTFLILVVTLFHRMYETRLLDVFPNRYHVENSFIYGCSGFFTMAWLLSIVCLTVALMLSINKLYLYTGVIFGGFFYAISVWSLRANKSFFLEIFGIEEKIKVIGFGVYRNEYAGLIESCYLFAIGLALLMAGLYLFERYGDI